MCGKSRTRRRLPQRGRAAPAGAPPLRSPGERTRAGRCRGRRPRVATRSLGPRSVLARLGGDEFAALLPGADAVATEFLRPRAPRGSARPVADRRPPAGAPDRQRRHRPHRRRAHHRSGAPLGPTPRGTPPRRRAATAWRWWRRGRRSPRRSAGASPGSSAAPWTRTASCSTPSPSATCARARWAATRSSCVCSTTPPPAAARGRPAQRRALRPRGRDRPLGGPAGHPG